MNIDALKKLCEFEHCRMETNDDYAQRLADHVFSLKPILAQLCRVVEAAEKTIEYADDYGDSFISKPIREALKELERLVTHD